MSGHAPSVVPQIPQAPLQQMEAGGQNVLPHGTSIVLAPPMLGCPAVGPPPPFELCPATEAEPPAVEPPSPSPRERVTPPQAESVTTMHPMNQCARTKEG